MKAFVVNRVGDFGLLLGSVGIGAVLYFGPARHDKMITLLPAHHLVADLALARALDH